MKQFSLLSPKDIYIEINGIKLASIKNYNISISKDIYNIKSFNNKIPVKTLELNSSINIKLLKVCLLTQENPIDFFNLSDFNLVIFKPKYQIIFFGCNWSDITESAEINSTIINSLSLKAQKQIKINF